MDKLYAAICPEPNTTLPSPTEIRAFLWPDYSPKDVDEDGFWNSNVLQIEHYPRGYVEIEIAEESEGRIILVSAYKEKYLLPAAYFIARCTNGVIFYKGEPPTKMRSDDLIPLLEESFDLPSATQRIEAMRRRLPTFFEKHYSFLADYIKASLFPLYTRNGRTILGRSTHPKLNVSHWAGKGYEKCIAYALDSEVPEGFFACLSIGYSSQEWTNVIWKRDGRKFRFSGRNMALYDESASAQKVASQLQTALKIWEEEDGDVLILDNDRMNPKDD